MIQLFAPLLLFLPRIALLYLINLRKELVLTKLEMLIAGSILWNYTAIMSSLILGAFTSSATVLFWPLNLIGVLLLICSALIIFKNIPKYLPKKSARARLQETSML